MANPAIRIANGLAPVKPDGKTPGDPMCIPMTFDFTTATEYDIDFYKEISSNELGFLQTAWIDNANNTAALIMTCGVTGQRIECPPNSQGFFSINVSDPPNFKLVTTPAAGGLLVNILFINVPIANTVWSVLGNNVVALTPATIAALVLALTNLPVAATLTAPTIAALVAAMAVSLTNLPVAATLTGATITALVAAMLAALTNLPVVASLAAGSHVALDAGNNAIGKVGHGYTAAQTPVQVSAVAANAITAATMPAVAGKTNYVTGIQFYYSGATANVAQNITLAGLLGGNIQYPALALAGSNFSIFGSIITFDPPLPASAVNTAISLTIPALGAGNNAEYVMIQGYVE